MNENSRKITVLKTIRLGFQLLQAFNYENFQSNAKHKIVHIFFATVLTSLLPILIILSCWYVIENDFEMTNIVASLPIVFSLFQIELSFIVMIVNNRIISDTIDGIQKVVNQRKLPQNIQKNFFILFSRNYSFGKFHRLPRIRTIISHLRECGAHPFSIYQRVCEVFVFNGVVIVLDNSNVSHLEYDFRLSTAGIMAIIIRNTVSGKSTVEAGA